MSWYWWFLLVSLLLFGVVLVYHMLTRKYVSPYTLEVYFGRKGCGKSTMLQKLAYQYYKRGWHVCADVGNTGLDIVDTIDATRLWQYDYPPNTLILIDEINLKWDNRDFKSFPRPLQEFLRLQRHKRVKIIMFSQTYDCDAKIRNLADMLYLQRKFLRVLTIAKPYVKTPVVLSSLDTHTEGRISDDFVPQKIWRYKIAYIPKWAKKFDSFR